VSLHESNFSTLFFSFFLFLNARLYSAFLAFFSAAKVAASAAAVVSAFTGSNERITNLSLTSYLVC
jgi:hypothetical protein